MVGMRTALAVVAMASTPALAGIATFYTSQSEFHLNNDLNGKMLKGVETFEESTVEQGAKVPFPNSLQNGVPRPTFESGINATNLIIQTNITPGPCPPTTNPSNNENALWVNGAGFLGSNSIKVGTDEFLYQLFSSIDLIFTSNDKTAIGVDLSTYPGFAQGHGGFVVCAYDQFDNVLGSFVMAGPTPTEPAKNFVGVFSAVPIGRVNIWGIFDVPQPFAVDNIEMWVPAPGAGVLLGLGGLFACRRKR